MGNQVTKHPIKTVSLKKQEEVHLPVENFGSIVNLEG